MKPDLQFVVDLAKQGGDMVLTALPNAKVVASKDVRDIATSTDFLVEDFIVKKIQDKFPDHTIIREEREDLDTGSDYKWIVDALDGTKYFITGVKFFSTSIALWKGEEPVLGAVYNPATQDCYRAERGLGSFMNDKPLRVSDVSELEKAIVSIDMYKSHEVNDENFAEMTERLGRILKNCYRMRAYGCGSLSLCFLAQGYIDVYYDLSGYERITDLGAGMLIAQEAGAKVAKVSDILGQFPGLDGGHVVISNGKVHDEFLELMRLDS